MEAIIVDDNSSYVKALAEQKWPNGKADLLSLKTLDQIGSLSPRQVAERITKQAGDDNAVVLINVNLKCQDNTRQDQAGVEVLKYLRLTQDFDDQARRAHCVLYSFQSVEQLLRQKPSSLIICSDGVTFEQLPSDFSELDLRALAKKTAADDLDEFLRGEFTLPDERHSWANWWAARQMMKLYYFEKIYDASRHQLGKYSELPAPSGIRPSVQSDGDTFSMEAVGEEVKDPQVRNALYLFDRSSVFVNEFDAEDRDRLEKDRRVLHKSDLKIGLIDDEAREISRNPGAKSIGWQTVYSHVLYDDERQVDNLLDATHMDVNLEPSEDGVLARLLKNIEEFNFDPYACIFLDLRLLEDSTKPEDVTNASGVRVLEKIREVEPSIPIIMTTASNKLSSFFEITKTGADAYWVKQGIDERRTTREAIENYARLLNLTSTALGEKYQFVRRFEKDVRELDKVSDPWWINKEWEYCEVQEYKATKVDKDDVIRVLYNSVMMLRTYLSETQMKADKTQSETYWVSAIIQQLSNIVERVHNIRNGATFPLKDRHRFSRYDDYECYRHDQIALYLTYIRHNASHHKGFENFTFDDIAFYVELLLLWLNNEAYAEGARGKYRGDEWHHGHWFIDKWSRDYNLASDEYSGHQLLRLYVSIAWWLNKLAQNAENPLLQKDRDRLRIRLRKITRKRKSDCEQRGEWAAVKSRFVDFNQDLIDVEEKLPEYLPA